MLGDSGVVDDETHRLKSGRTVDPRDRLEQLHVPDRTVEIEHLLDGASKPVSSMACTMTNAIGAGPAAAPLLATGNSCRCRAARESGPMVQHLVSMARMLVLSRPRAPVLSYPQETRRSRWFPGRGAVP